MSGERVPYLLDDDRLNAEKIDAISECILK
jgi:hypothetical protein